ncbi:hypothetical protein U27_03542 [Candidatus Vecturithrix granuli]|uniref:Sulfatase N-terminal domain-containing protein n=1 Tax=Vecturithrix granuli TaxID=1499967 RepID=A0A081BW75_VECG1|nr:hypothetical protein U27_03542 [Candidatus Vecturithrix granuli]
MMKRRTFTIHSIRVLWLFWGGIFLLLGGLSGCRETAHQNAEEKGARISHDFTQKPGGEALQILDYMVFDHAGKQYLGGGWWEPVTDPESQKRFIWSIGKQSQIKFYLADHQDIHAAITCAPLLKDRTQTIDITVNGQQVTTLELQYGIREYAFTIPQNVLRLGPNLMTFTYAYAVAPKDLGVSEDTRELGVKFFSLDFDPDLPNYSFPDHASHDLQHVVNISRIKLDDDTKIGIIQTPKSAYAFEKCYIPPNSSLKFFLGVHPAVKSQKTDVTFSIVVKEFQPDLNSPFYINEQKVFTEKIAVPKLRAWQEYTVDLSEFAGKVVSLSFNVLANVEPQKILAVWGEPRIYSEVSAPKYNVILITLDALRKDHITSYGYTRNTTPQLDSFAQETVQYTQCYTPVSWTLPSFASYYTALYAKTHQVGRIADNLQLESMLPLRRSYPTLPTFLKPYGYFTQIITSHAFFDNFYGLSNDFDNRDKDNLNHKMHPFYIDDIQRWLQKNKQERFFLHIHVIPPHTPYLAVAPYDEQFLDFQAACLDDSVKVLFSDRADNFVIDRNAPGDACQQDYIVDLYDAGLALADEFFGKIIAELHSQGLYDETLVIVSSDHGEQFWEHGRLGHGVSLYNEELQVPLLVKYPKSLHIDPQKIDSPVLTIDILPTILAMNHIPVPAYFHGESLFDSEDKALKTPEREYSFFSLSSPEFDEGVIWKQYKYLYSPKSNVEKLYDLQKDPAEQHNIAEAEPDVLERLRTALKEYQQTVNTSIGWQKNIQLQTIDQGKVPQASPDIDEETVKKLKELGYIK